MKKTLFTFSIIIGRFFKELGTFFLNDNFWKKLAIQIDTTVNRNEVWEKIVNLQLKGKRIRYLNLYTICVKEHGDVSVKESAICVLPNDCIALVLNNNQCLFVSAYN